MVLPLWGMLPKAQDNPQTIDEAIAAAIAAHEQDPTAHLGDGESLQAHKHDPVIDHPAQSLVADKSPYGLYDEIQTYTSNVNWSVEDGSALLNNGRWLMISLFSQSAFNAISNMPFINNAAYPLADLIYSFELQISGLNASDGQARIFWSIDNDPTNLRQIGFVKDGVDAKWIIVEGGSVIHSFTMGSGGVFTKYVTLFFDSINERIELYLDGELVSYYATADWHDYILQALSVDATRSSNTSVGVRIRYWKARYNLFVP